MQIEAPCARQYGQVMKAVFVSVVLGIPLAGCAQVEGLFDRFATTDPADVSAPLPEVETNDTGVPVPEPGARTAEAFDTTSEQQRAEAVAGAAAASGETDLGTTIASLGAPGESGFWLKTPLADVPGKGRVEYPDKGTSVVVDLIPLADAPGAGSQISLAAMRVIGADLTGLPELRVYRLPD